MKKNCDTLSIRDTLLVLRLALHPRGRTTPTHRARTLAAIAYLEAVQAGEAA